MVDIFRLNLHNEVIFSAILIKPFKVILIHKTEGKQFMRKVKSVNCRER